MSPLRGRGNRPAAGRAEPGGDHAAAGGRAVSAGQAPTGAMYATGARVSEAVKRRWRAFDFDRRVVSIWLGKRRVDRQVMLPMSCRSSASGWRCPSSSSSSYPRLPGAETQGGVGGPATRELRELLLIDATAACGLGRGLRTTVRITHLRSSRPQGIAIEAPLARCIIREVKGSVQRTLAESIPRLLAGGQSAVHSTTPLAEIRIVRVLDATH